MFSVECLRVGVWLCYYDLRVLLGEAIRRFVGFCVLCVGLAFGLLCGVVWASCFGWL